MKYFTNIFSGNMATKNNDDIDNLTSVLYAVKDLRLVSI